VTLTLNLPETLPFDPAAMPFKVRIIRNPRPKGFGANHNAAFASGCSGFFCVINPDIRLQNNPFPALTEILGNSRIGVVAPLILDPEKTIADSARKFPTVISILGKVFRRKNGPDYVITDQLLFPDWVAGMFMLFRRDVFEELHGFDRDYFLYYEDVDLCARLRLAGYLTALCPDVSAIHDAQRTSHRNLRYLKWHLSSMLRFFALSACRKISPGKSKK
jgi:GT2 family glycosyltransferase